MADADGANAGHAAAAPGADMAARAAAAAAAAKRSAPKAGLAAGPAAKKARDDQKAFALKLLKIIDESALRIASGACELLCSLHVSHTR